MRRIKKISQRINRVYQIFKEFFGEKKKAIKNVLYSLIIIKNYYKTSHLKNLLIFIII
jgi:hypothetical protein